MLKTKINSLFKRFTHPFVVNFKRDRETFKLFFFQERTEVGKALFVRNSINFSCRLDQFSKV